MTTAADNLALATTLESTAKHLKRHIAEEGQKVGAALGKTYALAAKEQIDAKDRQLRESAFELQRANDLIAELRRHQAPLNRAADKANAIATAVRRAHYAGEKTIDVKTLLDIITAPARPDDKENRT